MNTNYSIPAAGVYCGTIKFAVVEKDTYFEITLKQLGLMFNGYMKFEVPKSACSRPPQIYDHLLVIEHGLNEVEYVVLYADTHSEVVDIDSVFGDRNVSL